MPRPGAFLLTGPLGPAACAISEFVCPTQVGSPGVPRADEVDGDARSAAPAKRTADRAIRYCMG